MTTTAYRQTGIAIHMSGIPRSEIFVTTKIPCGGTTEEVQALIQYDGLYLSFASFLTHEPHLAHMHVYNI